MSRGSTKDYSIVEAQASVRSTIRRENPNLPDSLTNPSPSVTSSKVYTERQSQYSPLLSSTSSVRSEFLALNHSASTPLIVSARATQSSKTNRDSGFVTRRRSIAERLGYVAAPATTDAAHNVALDAPELVQPEKGLSKAGFKQAAAEAQSKTIPRKNADDLDTLAAAIEDRTWTKARKNKRGGPRERK